MYDSHETIPSDAISVSLMLPSIAALKVYHFPADAEVVVSDEFVKVGKDTFFPRQHVFSVVRGSDLLKFPAAVKGPEPYHARQTPLAPRASVDRGAVEPGEPGSGVTMRIGG